MKFRAEPKDALIFLLFCIFLFYVVSLGVLNLNSIALTSKAHGFNPLPAFSPKFLYPTVVFFIIALIVIIASVSSHFFEREKGFGFMSSKSNKGHSRWAKKNEMKKELVRVYADDEKFNAWINLHS